MQAFDRVWQLTDWRQNCDPRFQKPPAQMKTNAERIIWQVLVLSQTRVLNQYWPKKLTLWQKRTLNCHNETSFIKGARYCRYWFRFYFQDRPDLRYIRKVKWSQNFILFQQKAQHAFLWKKFHIVVISFKQTNINPHRPRFFSTKIFRDIQLDRFYEKFSVPTSLKNLLATDFSISTFFLWYKQNTVLEICSKKHNTERKIMFFNSFRKKISISQAV